MKSNSLIFTLCFLVTLPLFLGCLKEDELNLAYSSFEPKYINDGLIISSPINEQVDPQLLNKIYAEVYSNENLWSLRSLLVFRNRKLISESYLKNEDDISNRQIVWSCTKQIMGVLTGIALEQGIINSINDSLHNYFDVELTGNLDKKNITIKNLLTMRSGIDYNNEEQSDELLRQIPDDCIDFILNRPINSPQGIIFHYNDGNPQLMSALIQKETKKPAKEFANEFLFSKIEMTNYNWINYKDGVTLGGFGIETTPRELSKIALCVADSGRWKGQQIISPEWIIEMTSVQVEIENFEYSFGYFWWIDESRNVYFMWGAGGQFAFIVPEKNLVVVMTSFPNTAGEYEIQADEALEVVDKIIDASN